MRILSFDVGLRNLAFALIEWPDPTFEETNRWMDLIIESWEVVDFVTLAGSTARNSKSISGDRLRTMLFDFLMARKDLFETVDVLLVESQARAGAKFRLVQQCIHSFHYLLFRLSGRDPPKQLSYSSQQKLKCCIHPDGVRGLPHAGETPKTDTYAQRKSSAIKMIKELVSHLSDEQRKKWEPVLKQCKKKDDMADCLLQAIHYLQTIKVPRRKKRRVTEPSKTDSCDSVHCAPK